MNLKEAEAHMRAGGKVLDEDGDAWVWDAARGKPACVGESGLRMCEGFGPYTAVEEEKTVDETNDIMVAIGWGEWASHSGTHYRVNPDSGRESPFQCRCGDGPWCDTIGVGIGPYTKVKKARPAPATLAECREAEPHGVYSRDPNDEAFGHASPLYQFDREALEATDWQCRSIVGEWYSPNGTVEG